MQDRFRFRAWYKPSWEEHRMLYKVEQTYDFMRGEPESVHADSFGEVLEDDDFIVMQCTGLKDKNGKLIYEGDICKYKFEEIGEQKAIIYFSKELCSFLSKPLNDFQYTRINDCKVIGNIYENPEFLEDNK